MQFASAAWYVSSPFHTYLLLVIHIGSAIKSASILGQHSIEYIEALSDTSLDLYC